MNKISILFSLCLFLALSLSACGQETPVQIGLIIDQEKANLGPNVVSFNPDVTVTSWEYSNPADEERTNFPKVMGEPDAITFGQELHSAEILWREGGFDVVWSGFICSTHPILTISDRTIELWANDEIWNDCIAVGAQHAFLVELETDVAPSAWAYEFPTDAPQDE